MVTASTKTCPVCGAVNNANDLFCKDCGSSLAMVSTSEEQTAAFTPVTQTVDTQTITVTPVQPAPSSMPPQVQQQYTYPAAEAPASYGTLPPQESIRGAVLGWLAAILIMLIVGFFIWSSVLGDATRDRFTGWF